MNKHQRAVLIAFAALVAAMLLFPPYHFVGVGGLHRSFGYSWIFSPPNEVAIVNLGLLLTQWIGVGIVAAITFFLVGDTKSQPPANSIDEQPTQTGWSASVPKTGNMEGG